MQCSKTDKSLTEAIEELCDLVSKLRSEEGCPWDRAQTHQSLKPCIVNEAAEVLAAADLCEKLKDAENLCEELGDLLFLIGFAKSDCKRGRTFYIYRCDSKN